MPSLPRLVIEARLWRLSVGGIGSDQIVAGAVLYSFESSDCVADDIGALDELHHHACRGVEIVVAMQRYEKPN